jgi:hypothetical protein
MPWTDRFNKYYHLETTTSRDVILETLKSKIEAAKLNTGFSSVFKSPDYKKVTISGDFIIIRPVRFNGQVLGLIEVKLAPEFGVQPIYLPSVLMILGAIIGCIFLSWQKMLDGFMLFGLIVLVISSLINIPLVLAMNNNRLKSYIDRVLFDLKIPE